MTSRFRQAGFSFFALLIAWGALAYSYRGASKLKEYYPSYSARFSEPITKAKAISARRLAVESQSLYWPTFWSEESLYIESDLRGQNATAVYFSGGAGLAWPAAYIEGTAPGEADPDGIAVSSDLAFALWGGNDVTGLTAKAGGKKYTVRGVFESEGSLALVSMGEFGCPEGGWQALEAAVPSGGSLEGFEAFLMSSGLNGATTLSGPGIAFLFRSLSALPALILALFYLFSFMHWLKRSFGLIGSLLSWFMPLIIAPVLVWMLRGIPAPLIPSQWSDFSFYSRLYAKWAETLKNLASSMPGYRDSFGKHAIISQAIAILTGAIGSAFYALSKLFRGARDENSLN